MSARRPPARGRVLWGPGRGLEAAQVGSGSGSGSGSVGGSQGRDLVLPGRGPVGGRGLVLSEAGSGWWAGPDASWCRVGGGKELGGQSGAGRWLQLAGGWRICGEGGREAVRGSEGLAETRR